MRKNKRVCPGRKRAVFILTMALALGFTACGRSSYSYDKAASDAVSYAPAMNATGGAAMEAGFDTVTMEEAESESLRPMETGASDAVDNSAYFNDRKLIRTVDMEVETQEFDQLVLAVEQQVEALGGYIENMYTYNGSKYAYRSNSRNANLTARIPKQQLSAFLDMVSDTGNVVSRSENVEDVTLSYVDLESRKEALKIEQERLMELLQKAENLEDILTIEERLTNVRYRLDSMESQLRTYDNKVDFATVRLNIREVKELTPVVEETVWERISNGFRDSLKNVGEGLVDFLVWFVVHIPYLLIWAVVIIAIVVAIRLWIRSLKNKKARKQAGLQEKIQQNGQKDEPQK